MSLASFNGINSMIGNRSSVSGTQGLLSNYSSWKISMHASCTSLCSSHCSDYLDEYNISRQNQFFDTWISSIDPSSSILPSNYQESPFEHGQKVTVPKQADRIEQNVQVNEGYLSRKSCPNCAQY